MLQIQQNLSVRRLPRTPGPSSLLSSRPTAELSAQIQPHSRASWLFSVNVLSPRSYPGTVSTFIDTWARVEEEEEGLRLHVTVENKNNDDSAEFSGVGGETKIHLQRYRLIPAGDILPHKLFKMNVEYLRALIPPKFTD